MVVGDAWGDMPQELQRVWNAVGCDDLLLDANGKTRVEERSEKAVRDAVARFLLFSCHYFFSLFFFPCRSHLPLSRLAGLQRQRTVGRGREKHRGEPISMLQSLRPLSLRFGPLPCIIVACRAEFTATLCKSFLFRFFFSARSAFWNDCSWSAALMP